MTRPKPNFFVVGAPKCGTTSLHEYLDQHPEVYMPPIKEPHHFGTDLQVPTAIWDDERYFALFDGAEGKKAVGEASVYYLYSRRAADEIHRFDPQARIIIMLRNPADMVYSLHSEYAYNATDDLSDFRQALDAEADRKAGRRLPKRTTFPERLYYTEVAKYHDQVRRFLDRFPRNQVHLIIFDDWKRDSLASFQDVCKFLDVDPTFRPKLEVANPNKTVKTAFLRDMMRPTSPLYNLIGRPIAQRPALRRYVHKVNQWNTVPVERAQLPPDLRARLNEAFATDVAQLSGLLGRDLTHWVAPPAAKSPPRAR